MSQFIPDEDAAMSYVSQGDPVQFLWLACRVVHAAFRTGKTAVRRQEQCALRRTRVRETGELDSPTAEPIVSKELSTLNVAEGYTPSLADFFVPIAVLLGFAIVPWLITGSPMIFEAFGLAVVSSIALSVIRGMSVHDAFEGLVDGIKGVTIGAIILGLAVTLAKVSDSSGRLVLRHRSHRGRSGRHALYSSRHPDDHLHGRLVLGGLVLGNLRGRFPDRPAAGLRDFARSAVRHAGVSAPLWAARSLVTSARRSPIRPSCRRWPAAPT